MELILWQLWYNYFSVKCGFISWYTFSTTHKWLLPCYAPVACTSQKAAEWSEKVSTSHGNHSIQSVYHTTFLLVILCECISVLKHVCPMSPVKPLWHSATYCRTHWLIFITGVSMPAAHSQIPEMSEANCCSLNNVFRTIIIVKIQNKSLKHWVPNLFSNCSFHRFVSVE